MQYLAIFIVPKTVAIFLSVFIFPRLLTRRRRHNFYALKRIFCSTPYKYAPFPLPNMGMFPKKIPRAVAIFINLCFPKITHTRRRGHDFYALKRLFCWMPYKYSPIPLPNMRMFSKYPKQLQSSSIVGFTRYSLTQTQAYFYALKRLYWMQYKYAPIPLPNIGWKNLRRDRRASRCAEACLATECGCPFS